MGLEGGVYRFGRSKMYHKKAAYKFLKKKTAKKAAPKKPTFVEKPIGGAKGHIKEFLCQAQTNGQSKFGSWCCCNFTRRSTQREESYRFETAIQRSSVDYRTDEM